MIYKHFLFKQRKTANNDKTTISGESTKEKGIGMQDNPILDHKRQSKALITNSASSHKYAYYSKKHWLLPQSRVFRSDYRKPCRS